MSEKGAGETISYRDAGVDIDRADALVKRIKAISATTTTRGVLGRVGGFGALFELPLDRYRHPVLVSGTDGVGTKLRLAIDTGCHQSVGIDLVAMCVNDVLALGAEPLFFLDYFATARLDLEVAEAVIQGVAAGCKLAGTALIGGETAELPGMYADKDYDLAGFCVGVVERDRIIDGSLIKPGHVLLGLASSGPHSNGYSLIRKVVERAGVDLQSRFGARTLAETLLEPTRIYVDAVQHLIRDVPVLGIAHITGGGLLENVPRILPAGCRANIDTRSWKRPPIFDWLREAGNIQNHELYRTFNCGVGLVVCVDSRDAERAGDLLRRRGQEVAAIGVIDEAESQEPCVCLDGLTPTDG